MGTLGKSGSLHWGPLLPPLPEATTLSALLWKQNLGRAASGKTAASQASACVKSEHKPADSLPCRGFPHHHPNPFPDTCGDHLLSLPSPAGASPTTILILSRTHVGTASSPCPHVYPPLFSKTLPWLSHKTQRLRVIPPLPRPLLPRLTSSPLVPSQTLHT